jgi:hypothetical protein
MRWLTIVALAVGCAADDGKGGYSEDDFREDFAAAYCDQLVECGADPCADATGTGTTTTSPTGGCTFSADAAQACIDAAWACTEEVAGFSFPIPAEVCNEVFDCGTTSSTTPTTSTN